MTKSRFAFAIVCFVLAGAGVVEANAGVPMIFITMPGMLMALVPVVLVETFVLSRWLPLPTVTIVKAVAVSNIVSTVIGIPLVWICLVAIQLGTGGGMAYGIDTVSQRLLAVTWQAPWLIPYEADLDWMVPAASGVLLVPFFFASLFVERRVNRWMLSAVDDGKVRRGTRDANLWSYILLGFVVLGFLVNVLIRRGA